MRERHGDIPDIPGPVIERLATTRRLINRDPCAPLQEKVPLVRLRVPMQFAHGAGPDGDERGGDVGGGGEGGGVDNFDSAG